MKEFKNNKEGKIDELKVCSVLLLTISAEYDVCVQRDIKKQKDALQKHNVVLKTHQKDAQTAQLELGAPLLCFLSALGAHSQLRGP